MTIQWKYLPELPENNKPVLGAVAGWKRSSEIMYNHELERWCDTTNTSYGKNLPIYAWAELPELPPLTKPEPIDTLGVFVEMDMRTAVLIIGKGKLHQSPENIVRTRINYLRSLPMSDALSQLTDVLSEGLLMSTYLQMRACIENPNQDYKVIITDLKPVENTTESLGFTEEHLDVATGKPKNLRSIGEVSKELRCPECKGFLVETNPGVILAGIPPRKAVHCNSCSYEGFRIV